MSNRFSKVMGAGAVAVLLTALALLVFRQQAPFVTPERDEQPVASPQPKEHIVPDLGLGLPRQNELGETGAQVIKKQYAKLEAKHRTAVSNRGHRYYQLRWQLDWQHSQHYIEARLFALCFPEPAESLAIESARKAEVEKSDALLAIRVLGTLAQHGRKGAESMLAKLASGDDPLIVSEALEQLSSYQSHGLQNSIYAAQCRKPILEALYVGPFGSDADTRAALSGVIAKGDSNSQYPLSAAIVEAKDALERMSLLDTEAGKGTISLILQNRTFGEGSLARTQEWTSWALKVVQLRSETAILPILRERLDSGEAQAGSSFEAFSPAPSKSTEHGYAHATGDMYFDEVLLTFQALGGVLNNTEKARLAYYGYLGDPNSRLRELQEKP